MLQPLMEDGKDGKDGRPHWENDWPEDLWPVFEDFRVFLTILWDHLGLPEPTRAQREAAHRLQYGYDTHEAGMLPEDRLYQLRTRPREDIVRCFRSMGKSYITAGFACWRLMRNPRDEKILVVSASGSKAKEFVSQTKGILLSLDLCQWLLQGDRQKGATRRDQADQFDVANASLSQSYSVAARGITGQITGSRATLLISDDMETISNSKTEDARRAISRTITSDFVPITKTEHGKGDILVLGTPQTEESIYNVMVKTMGFRCMTIPVEWPGEEKLKNYVLTTDQGETVDIMAPYLRAMAERDELAKGIPTDTRFTMDELAGIKSKGLSSFALQYMLDTSLSDAERYPLRQHDLLVFSTHPDKAPLTVQWGRDSEKRNTINDIPNLGFSGDGFLRPLFVDTDWAEYETKVLIVDPSGRGADETAWCVMGTLGGHYYLLHLGAVKGDPEQAFYQIAQDAKRFGVSVIEVEPNYGQGIWTEAMKPVLRQVWPAGCSVVEGDWAKGQKELRIIDTLEPVLSTHRLVIDESLVRQDTKQDDPVYSLMYQLTHVTKDRGSLKHDDRLDCVAAAVAKLMKVVAQSPEDHWKAHHDQLMEQEIEDFMEMKNNIGQTRGRMRSARKSPDGTREDVIIVKV